MSDAPGSGKSRPAARARIGPAEGGPHFLLSFASTASGSLFTSFSQPSSRGRTSGPWPSPDVAIRRHPISCEAAPAIGGGHDPPAGADPETDRRARQRSGGHPRPAATIGYSPVPGRRGGGRRVNFGALHSEEDADDDGGPSRDSRRPGTAAGPTLLDGRSRTFCDGEALWSGRPREGSRVGSDRVESGPDPIRLPVAN